MNRGNWSLSRGIATLIAAFAVAMLGLLASSAFADETIVGLQQATATDRSDDQLSDHRKQEPIVGLWQAKATDGKTVLWDVYTAWTSDGLEIEDYALPILEGHICYGHWIKLHGRTYGQTHPYFEYDPTTGEWAGTSAYINYTVTVSNDGKTYTGKQNGKFGVPGPNPYVAGGTPWGPVTVTATKIEVDKSLLP